MLFNNNGHGIKEAIDFGCNNIFKYIVTILILIGFTPRLLHCAIYPTQHFLNAGLSVYF
jgi:hypothetical protein